MSKPIPNPQSKLLSQAVVGGIGLGVPPDSVAPPGMATVLLYVPVEQIIGQDAFELQRDLGLPWYVKGGAPVWLEELVETSR